MSYRYMRMMVFFDLPVSTAFERREYNRFRKFLINSGYIMMQESVYTKLALNGSVVDGERKKLLSNKPDSGLVQLLVVTEKQFSKIEYIVGKKVSVVEDTEDRVVII